MSYQSSGIGICYSRGANHWPMFRFVPIFWGFLPKRSYGAKPCIKGISARTNPLRHPVARITAVFIDL